MTENGNTNNKISTSFYKLNLATMPDKLFQKSVPVARWLEVTTCQTNKFPANSLNQLVPVSREVEIERIVGISLYMLGNVLPFVVPLLIVASLLSETGKLCFQLFLVYWSTLYSLCYYYFWPKFEKAYERKPLSFKDLRENQYLHTERNNQKYMSLQFVWPQSVHYPSLKDKPVIFCAIPHGAAPFGITAYPLWSKLWNDKFCHWTCAPIVLKLPFIKTYMKQIGYIPAKAKSIIETLTKKEENVGIILDGIAGMFQSHNEIAHIQQRKGIVKIALRAGVPIIPVYGFGHTSLWKVVVDPMGLLEYLSTKLEISITPFFGRWGWFLGPPKRVAVCMCLGEPVHCPKMDDPQQQDIDKYHSLLLDHYKDLFETHKEAYGWKDKELKFV